MKKVCVNCAYSLQINKVEFQCRRYAPRRIHGVGMDNNNRRFPIVHFDDWCGEFVLGHQLEFRHMEYDPLGNLITISEVESEE